jgi:hypothetical protein
VYNHNSLSDDPVGCGLLGCVGGVIFGLFGGGGLLVLASLLAALAAPVPAPASPPSPAADLRVTLDESFLNRFAEQPAAGSVTVDVLPGNRVNLVVNSSMEAFGLPVPVQIVGLFELQLNGNTLHVNLIDTQVSGGSIPVDASSVFSEDAIVVNQELQMAVDEISRTLGVPVTLTNLSTTDNQIQLEIREVP